MLAPAHTQAAENYLRRSGLRWTIVRPGGLKSEAPAEVGRLVTSREDSLFGLETDPGRAISRDTVRCLMQHMAAFAFVSTTSIRHRSTLQEPYSRRCTLTHAHMQVAAVLVAALRQPLAADKVVEIVAAPDAPELPEDAWFAV